MMRFKIDKDVPVKRGRRSKYPFGSMEIGDSFYFPTRQYARVLWAMVKFQKANNAKFLISKASSRCWRTA